MRPKRQAAAAAAALLKAEAGRIEAEKEAEREAEKARKATKAAKAAAEAAEAVAAAKVKKDAVANSADTSNTSSTSSASNGDNNNKNNNNNNKSSNKDSTPKYKKKKTGKKKRGQWHTSNDERMRRSVIEQIMQLLAQCKKSTNQNAKAKLVNLARRLEAALYRAATSKAQYSKLEKDPAVLRQKVRQLARESATKRAILSAATPEAAAAIAATAGASLEEQKKIKEQHLRILRQRQRLLLLRHGSRCRVPIGHKCQVTPHCAVMQKLWQHIAQCKMQQCDYPHCVASRHVLGKIASFSLAINTLSPMKHIRFNHSCSSLPISSFSFLIFFFFSTLSTLL